MNEDKIKRKTKLAWNNMAKNYQRNFRISLNNIHYGPSSLGENELKLLGDVKGKHVLDLGCGGGQNSIILAKMGAKVIAIDYSKEQLAYAIHLAKKEKVKVEFINFDIEKIDRLKFSGKFDIIFSSYTLQYVPNLTRLFKKLSKIIKLKGIFVFATLHPLFTSDWGKFKGKEYALVYDYFNVRKSVYTMKFGKKVAKVTAFIHNIMQISSSLNEAGFLIERIIEQNAIKNAKKTPYYDGWYDSKWLRWPHTVIFKAKKQ
jgi:2-polyprenyl-3-methyl-5-hydroxy-6-metoxy-1,4-benzoquinol methylase